MQTSSHLCDIIPTLLSKKDLANDSLMNGRNCESVDIYLEIIADLEKISTSTVGNDREEVDQIKVACLNNLSVAYMNLTSYNDVITVTSTALNINKKNVKALFRRSQAYIHTENFSNAIEDLVTLLSIEPANQQAKNLLKQVEDKLEEENNPTVQEPNLNSNIESSPIKATDPAGTVYQEHFMNPNWNLSQLNISSKSSNETYPIDFIADMSRIIDLAPVPPSTKVSTLVTPHGADMCNEKVSVIHVSDDVSHALQELVEDEVKTTESVQNTLLSKSLQIKDKPIKKNRKTEIIDNNIDLNNKLNHMSLRNKTGVITETASSVWNELLQDEKQMINIVSNRIVEKEKKAKDSQKNRKKKETFSSCKRKLKTITTCNRFGFLDGYIRLLKITEINSNYVNMMVDVNSLKPPACFSIIPPGSLVCTHTTVVNAHIAREHIDDIESYVLPFSPGSSEDFLF
eukprot:gene5377-10752_t